MPEIKYKITDVRPVPSADSNRRGQQDMLISWVEDGVRPYSLTMPADIYTAQKGLEAVVAEVTLHSHIVNTEGSVGS